MKPTASHSPKKWPLAALATADLAVFGVANPESAPSQILFVGFLLLVANFYVILLAALKLAAWYGVSPGRRRQRFIWLMTAVFSGLAALQSIGELSPRDVLVLFPLASLLYLYLSYGRAQTVTPQGG